MKHAFLAVLLLALASACTATSSDLERPDELTLVGPVSFFDGYPALNDDGTVNVVVEIPAGTTAKWEVDKDGIMRWELENGAPRVVKYLGYPGNYGMVPCTLLSKDQGGDGDALDVIVLGPTLEQGRVIPVSIVGVLELLDGGEQDDKLLAVQPGTALASVDDLDDLQRDFPGVTTIVEAWFTGYKGPGEIEARGFAGRARAFELLSAAADAFRRARADAGR